MDVVVYALCRKLISDSIAALGDVFTIKGIVPSYDDLPTSGNKNGDFYLVGPMKDGTYDEYFWSDANIWEKMGSTGSELGGIVTVKDLYAGEDGTGTPEHPADGTVLQIVNSGMYNNFLAKDNTIEYTPTEDFHPATKKYVDDEIENQPEATREDIDALFDEEWDREHWATREDIDNLFD